MKKVLYQDIYNPQKTWEVTTMNNGFYLKQFICGRQFGRGLRTTKSYIESIGIFNMPVLSENEHSSMFEKVLSVVHTSPFTAYYTVKRTEGFLETRIVHRCPKCGVARLIIRGDENSMFFADAVFGFRNVNGVEYIQSYCRSCRSCR